jgi:hypothetical protein
MEDDKLYIPEDVVDPKSYRIAMALKRNPAFANNIYIASDNTEINIASLPHRLKKAIEHLSPSEQETILDKKYQYDCIRGKLSAALAKAYRRAGRYGGKEKNELNVYRLSAFEEDIIELLGRMFTTEEVVKIMVEDNGIECTPLEVKQIFREHLAEIEKKREEFRNKVTDVRLYNKRPRLEELSWMYSKMKMRYIALNSVDCYNAMLRTLEQIRKEAEGDIITVNGALDVNIEVNIRAQIQREIYKTINLKEIIIGRVASRMNFDPLKLLSGLHNSMYAKFVDIGGDYDENAVMEYPSNKAYDFAEIERTAEAKAINVAADPVTEEEKESANAIKQMFLEKIRKQKSEMEQRNIRWDDIAKQSKEEIERETKLTKRDQRMGDAHLKTKKYEEQRKKMNQKRGDYKQKPNKK